MMIPGRRPSRREILARLGVGAAVLPLLSVARSHEARAAGNYPRRFVVLGTEGGHWFPQFFPQGSGDDLAGLKFPNNIEPLEPYKQDLLFFGPIGNCTSRGGHEFRGNMLVGRHYAAPDDEDPRSGGISLDQFIANDIAKSVTLPVHSLCLAAHVSTGSSVSSTTINAAGRQQDIALENNPQKVFDRLFKGRDLGTDELARLRAMKQSVLDQVLSDLKRYSNVLGTDDRTKIEAHMDGVRRLEQQLSAAPGTGCVPPMLPQFDFSKDVYVGDPSRAAEINKQLPAIIRAQMDLMIAALACDSTRVATLMIGKSGGVGQISSSWPGLPKEVFPNGESYRGHHQDLAHAHFKEPPAILVQRWHVAQAAYFIDRLKNTPEPGGAAGETMLANTLFLYTNPMSSADAHVAQTLPWFIAGSAGGKFKQGRFVRLGDWKTSVKEFATQVDHNCLLLTIANAFAQKPETTWGDLSLPSYKEDPSRQRSPGCADPDPRYKGPLPELLA